VPRGVLPASEGGVIPIERDSVVLPARDFNAENIDDYLRISIPNVAPCGLAGTPWGDPRVAGAARIAELLADVWRDAKLFRIRLAADEETNPRARQPVYELETRGRPPHRIIWGSAPEAPPPGAALSDARLLRLDRLVESVGNLDQASQSQWDLRGP